MNEEKRIEEMAYEMTQYKETVCERIEHNNCLLKFHTNAFVNCHFCKLAEHLITEKGYRKASEIFEEIIEALTEERIEENRKADSALEAQDTASYEVYSYAEDKLATLVTALSLYKKKYTEGERGK